MKTKQPIKINRGERMKAEDTLVMDETYSGSCYDCFNETKWFNLQLQEHHCMGCFDKWLEGQNKEDTGMKVNKFNEIHVYHSDAIYKAKRGQAIWYIKALWAQYHKKWLKYQEEQVDRNWQGLIQCRHYVIACTRILKDRGEWDEKMGVPLADKKDRVF
jgi:hypothetical protein